jgi:hypothetical protein
MNLAICMLWYRDDLLFGGLAAFAIENANFVSRVYWLLVFNKL